LNNSAILITYNKEDSIKESLSLCESAGYQVFKIFKEKYLNSHKFGIGESKVKELIEIIESRKPDVIVFDEILRPVQHYNLASRLKINILDREALILQIFEHRATSKESKLQVKLAQLRYEMSRAKEKVRLAKTGEQPGFFGIGKFEVDVYYNDIKHRMYSVKEKLAKAGKQRALHRQGRKRMGFKIISLAGYTSAGKTTLFNSLTGEDLKKGPELFTTLSTTVRKFITANKEILVSDTVGFISKLPTYMIQSFKSTLEELTYADIVVLVVDISDPPIELKKKFASCIKTLIELGVENEKIIYALNKSDLISPNEIVKKAEILRIKENKKWIPISAAKNQNITRLRELLNDVLKNHIVGKKREPVKFEITYEDRST